MRFDFSSNPLCLVDEFGGLVCRNPIREQIGGKDYLSWFDMTHERRFQIQKVVTDKDDRFEFVTEGDLSFTIQPMTLELYKRKVKPRLVSDPGIENESDLEKHFLRDAWVV